MNQEQIVPWIEGLKQQAQQSMLESDVERSFALLNIVTTVERWLKAGMTGELPVTSAQLQQLQITLPDIQPTPPVVDLSPGTSPSEADWLVDTLLSSDTDTELQTQLKLGVAALEAGELLRARTILDSVRTQAEGTVRDQAEAYLQQVQRQQQQHENELVATAQAVDQQTPGDLHQRRNAWRAVLASADPQGEAYRQAEQALQAIEQTQQRADEGHAITEKLQQLRGDIRVAEANKQINQLQRAVDQLEGLRSQALSPDMAEQVTSLLVDTTQKLNALKETTGQVRTLLYSGNRESAYKHALHLTDQGHMEVWDPRSNKERPAGEMLNEAAGELLEFRKTKALERQQRAKEAIKKGNLEQAVRLYQEALSFLTYLTLRTETHNGIEYVVGGTGDLPQIRGEDLVVNERAELQDELQEAQLLYERWQRGWQQFQAAEQEADPRQALGMLRAAEAIFQEEPPLAFTGIKAAIERREQDLSNTLAVLVENACIEVQAALIHHDFVTARQHLSDARSKSSEVAHPAKRLTAAIEQMNSLAEEVRQTEERFIAIKSIREEVEKALAADPPDQELAEVLLNQLDEQERKQPEATRLKQRIATMQSTDKNWAEAQRAYREENWQVVIDTCQLLTSSQYQQQAVVLQGRAQAMLGLHAARQHRAHIPPEFDQARQQYTQVRELLTQHGTDSQTQAALTEAEQQVNEIDALIQRDAQIAQEIDQVRTLIETAQQSAKQDQAQPAVSLTLRPEWKQANEMLIKLLAQPSTRTAELTTLQATLFTAWRTDYLGRIRKCDMNQAQLSACYRLVDELQTEHLIHDPQDRRLARTIELDYLLNQTSTWRAQPRPDWQKIEANERRVLELLNMGYHSSQDPALNELEVQQRIYSAKIAQLRSQVQKLLSQDQTEAAAQQLEEALAGEDFNYDVDLTIELIKLYLQLKRFDVATQLARGIGYANLLDAKTTSGLWCGLIRAAELLSQSDYQDAITQIAYVKDTFPSGRDQLQQWLKDNIETTVDNLVRQAIADHKDKRILAAVQRYAEAQQLLDMIDRRDQDLRVTQGLTDLSGEVAKEMATACQKADNLTIEDNRKPDIVIKEARDLLKRLKAIQLVHVQLNLGQAAQDLDRTVVDLEERLEDWEQIQRKLEDARKLYDEGRCQTWDFGEARRLTQEVKRESNFQSQVKELLQSIESCEKWVKQINPLIEQLGQAILAEEFDRTIQLCDELETTWRQMQRELDPPLAEEGFIKQKKLQHLYGFTRQQSVEDWQEHRRIASELKTNYEQWQRYATELRQLKEQTDALLRKVEKDLKDQSRPLRELAADATTCETNYATLEQRLKEMDTMPAPDSNPAHKEQQKLKEQLQSADLEAKQRQSKTLAESCNDKIEQLKRLLIEIEKRIYNPKYGNNPPNNRSLEGKIEEAERIDPHDQRVQDARDALENRKANPQPRPKRGWFR